MDFELNEEQHKLRSEVRKLLDEQLPSDWTDYMGTTIDDSVVHSEEGWMLFKRIAHEFGKRGWLSMNWPKEYGGGSRTNVDYLIFLEEIARHGSPGFNAIGTKMFAPTLITYGSKEQKERYLGPISRGEEFWCEGFSEPEAGSDLAALKTKAIRKGDIYIVNGQKTWCTFASYSEYCCLLARTDPSSARHRGISFLLVDLKTQGVTVSPIENMVGEPHFGEIFFEDVEVPVTNLVGEENDGWKVAQTFLSFERIYIAPFAAVQRMIEQLSVYIKGLKTPNQTKVRQIMADLTAEVEIGRLLCYQVAWMQDKGISTEWHAAMTRMFGTKLIKRASSIALSLLGLYGHLDLKDRRAPLHGWIEHLYLNMIAATIAAGTTEIQRTVIAIRGLEMKNN